DLVVREETVAAGGAAAPYAGIREGDRGLAIPGEDPVDRPGEGLLHPPPSHALLPRDRADGGEEDLGEEFLRLPPLHLECGRQILALGRLLAPEGVERDADLLREALGRLGGLALRVEGDAHRRSDL